MRALSNELTTAIANYEASMRRALLMSRIQALAEYLDDGSAEEQELAYILRGMWIAAHQGRVSELYAAVDPLVGRWLDESAQPHVRLGRLDARSVA